MHNACNKRIMIVCARNLCPAHMGTVSFLQPVNAVLIEVCTRPLMCLCVCASVYVCVCVCVCVCVFDEGQIQDRP